MYPTHRKKPVEVTLIEFVVDSDGEPINKHVIRRGNHDEYFVYNELHKSEINLEVGDYVNVSTGGDIYPIKKHIVEETYEKIQ